MDQIELIGDGDGIAVLGDTKAVERFLSSEGIASVEFELPPGSRALSAAAGAAHAVSAIAAGSGRWVQVTHESASFIADAAQMMKGPADGIVRAIVMESGTRNRTKHIVQIVQDSTTVLTNPAVLAGVAGVMTQLAMQQAMKEIGDYLAVIDAKLDDVLRAQKDAALAEMIAVGLVLDDAMTVRADVGRVSEVTWSKVQGSSLTIATAQAYALRRLDVLTEKVERARPGERAGVVRKGRGDVEQWLAVLARCVQLENALGVLELDRVLDAAPDELERHRVGLRRARANRRELIARTTDRLMTRLDAVAGLADDRVLFDPFGAKAVVSSTNDVARAVVGFHRALGIDDGREAREGTRWLDAVDELRGDLLEAGADGVETAVKVGTGALDRARSLTNRIARDIAERTRPDDERKALDPPE